jgi:hypothetical protein
MYAWVYSINIYEFYPLNCYQVIIFAEFTTFCIDTAEFDSAEDRQNSLKHLSLSLTFLAPMPIAITNTQQATSSLPSARSCSETCKPGTGVLSYGNRFGSYFSSSGSKSIKLNYADACF